MRPFVLSCFVMVAVLVGASMRMLVDDRAMPVLIAAKQLVCGLRCQEFEATRRMS